MGKVRIPALADAAIGRITAGVMMLVRVTTTAVLITRLRAGSRAMNVPNVEVTAAMSGLTGKARTHVTG